MRRPFISIRMGVSSPGARLLLNLLPLFLLALQTSVLKTSMDSRSPSLLVLAPFHRVLIVEACLYLDSRPYNCLPDGLLVSPSDDRSGSLPTPTRLQYSNTNQALIATITFIISSRSTNSEDKEDPFSLFPFFSFALCVASRAVSRSTRRRTSGSNVNRRCQQ